MSSRVGLRRLALLARGSRNSATEVAAFAVPVTARGLASVASQLNTRVITAPRRASLLQAAGTGFESGADIAILAARGLRVLTRAPSFSAAEYGPARSAFSICATSLLEPVRAPN